MGIKSTPRTGRTASTGLAIKNSQGAVFLQRGPNQPTSYVGCVGITGFSSARPEPEYGYCIEDGEYRVKSITQGPPEGTSFDITEDQTALASAIDRLPEGCQFSLIIKHSTCGKPSNACIFDVVRVVPALTLTSDDPGDLVGKDEEGRIERTKSVSSPYVVRPVYKPYPAAFPFPTLEGDEVGDDTVNGHLHIPFGNASCGGSCGLPVDACDVIVTGTNSGSGTPAAGTNEPGIAYSLDGGATWTFVPFDLTTYADISGNVFLHAVLLDSNIFVAIGADSAGGEIHAVYGLIGADGASVTGVAQIATALTTPSIGAVYTDGSNVFVVAGTSIYMSDDAGATWTEVNTPVAGDVLRSIAFSGLVGYAVGNDAAGTLIYKSDNGGVSWTDISPTPSLGQANAVRIIGDYAWLGTANGLYYSRDGGSTWSLRTFAGNGAVTDLDFYDEYFGVVVVGSAVHMTYDGGYNWCLLDAPGAITPVGVEFCGQGEFWVHNLTGTLYKYAPK